MASLIDTTEENVAPAPPSETLKAIREVNASTTASKAAEEAQSRSAKAARPEWCPEKFWDAEKGKVMEEKLAQSYISLESSHGRMANDLGQQRKLTDRLLDLKRETDLSKNSPPPPPKVTTQELLDDPTAALDKHLTAKVAEKTEEVAQRLQRIEMQQAAERFVSKHPDYQDYNNSPEFQAWVTSSLYRQRAATRAYQGDFEAADELLSEFKTQKGTSSKPTAAAETQKPSGADDVSAARKASLEAGSAGSEGGSPKGKILLRRDLLKLQAEDPDAYYSDDVQAVVLKAYAEGRVR